MDATAQVKKTRRALEKLKRELDEAGEVEQVKAIEAVLKSEMSILRLAAILAPQN